MSKFAVILYPDFSLQEITCLTSALSVWFEEKIDFIASENREYCSEEGLRVMPTKTIADVNITDYKCIVLPGTINPLPALYDDRLIEFLRGGINTDVTFAAISSSPILLAKAGVLDGRKFTAGFFMQMAETFSFVENENFIHKGIVCDGNVITGIGMFFREFAETVLHKFGYDVGSNFMRGDPEDYTEEELTFYCTLAAGILSVLRSIISRRKNCAVRNASSHYSDNAATSFMPPKCVPALICL